tara:strand:- start:1727 stop:2062 length:336 start_codon:yes stop_codon:yes gene_type:complete
MGQPINVLSTHSFRPGIYRFEINRCLTGMGHERFNHDDEIIGQTPADELARRLFSLEGVKGVQLNSNMITVEATETDSLIDQITEVIKGLYLYYVDGVEVPTDDEVANSEV